MQDQLQAGIQEIRARTRNANLTAGVLNIRIAREQMKDDGELSPSQFNDLELADGRLPNGLDVISLFTSKDSQIHEFLALDTEDPLDVSSYDALDMLDKIEAQIVLVQQAIDEARSLSSDFKARCALAALVKLQSRLMGEAVSQADTLLAEGEAQMNPEEIVSESQASANGNAESDMAESTDKPEDTAEATGTVQKAASDFDLDDTLVTNADIKRLKGKLRKHAVLLRLFEAGR
jgi:hypothetical protein